MRKTSNGLMISLGFAVAALGFSVAAWKSVPAIMPVHWNAAGQPDGFAARAIGLLMIPVVIALIAPFITWAARKRAGQGVTVITIASSAFMFGTHVFMVNAAMSADGVLSMRALMSMLGVLFAVLGAAMPMLSQNEVAGVRTRWTLASELNWKLTHRFGAWAMVTGGALCIVASVVLSGQVMFWVCFAAIMIGSLLPVAYSYLLHKLQLDRL